VAVTSISSGEHRGALPTKGQLATNGNQYRRPVNNALKSAALAAGAVKVSERLFVFECMNDC
jgi:hypothetical protein